MDIACGCGDAQTLAVSDTGIVYSWGDGDYGKLGRIQKEIVNLTFFFVFFSSTEI